MKKNTQTLILNDKTIYVVKKAIRDGERLFGLGANEVC